MITVTKIFRFETAHAIHGYDGLCKHLHGHSYVLHVTLSSNSDNDDYIKTPGFIIDFKELKKQVSELVVLQLDHHTILSSSYLNEHPELNKISNLLIWEIEPSAENILIFIRNNLKNHFKDYWAIERLKLYETADSYAEWINTKA